ncbi:uncharacterized protein LOC105381628 [Plutella xylostella]|uniref:uncharacterized protein LOC105381628 n=1 Tax=Plutella xylostella TaxID=51655 RepID=UPI0020323135|nr:uncharacterized protein LOC105381628 [Plutella xylostella]
MDSSNIIRNKLSKSRDTSSLASAAMASKHLASHWMERVLEDNANEEPAGWRVKLLDTRSRSAVWCVCALLGVYPRSGAAAEACRLLERHFAAILQDWLARMDSQRVDPNIWDNYKRQLSKKVPLLMASCVQLAAKMNCAGLQITAKKVKTTLASTGLNYSIQEVIQAEFDVFRSLGFRVPLYCSLEIALLLAQQPGCGAGAGGRGAGAGGRCEGAGGRGTLAAAVEAAELYRSDITRRTLRLASLEHTDPTSGGTLRTLPLCAGAVAACRQLATGRSSTTHVHNLALLTKNPQLLISCVCNLIVQAVLSPESLADGSDDDEENERCSRKRRRSDSS